MISFNIEEEDFDEKTGKLKTKTRTLIFEHSLKSLSIWEAKYKIPLLSSEKTPAQMVDYILMMCVNEDIGIEDLDNEMIMEINDYIKDVHSATTITSSSNDSNSRRIMTSEVIYAYMANGQIPFTCEEWHLNNLLKLIGVLSELNSPKKEKSQAEIYEENRRLNRERRERMNSKG